MPQGKNAIFGRNIIQFYYNSPIYAALAGCMGREDAAAGIFGLNIEMLLHYCPVKVDKWFFEVVEI